MDGLRLEPGALAEAAADPGRDQPVRRGPRLALALDRGPAGHSVGPSQSLDLEQDLRSGRGAAQWSRPHRALAAPDHGRWRGAHLGAPQWHAQAAGAGMIDPDLAARWEPHRMRLRPPECHMGEHGLCWVKDPGGAISREGHYKRPKCTGCGG